MGEICGRICTNPDMCWLATTRKKNLEERRRELQSGTTSSYQQDGLGSVTSLSNAAGAVAQNYTFNSYGKVVNTSQPKVQNSAVISITRGGTSFKYDPFGRRIQKSSTSTTTNYLYDGSNLL